ncbi:hypothetical protein GS506_20725 [Rhodococcus hoagii]|nr:hypothetical protein [Prescottella equi]
MYRRMQFDQCHMSAYSGVLLGEHASTHGPEGRDTPQLSMRSASRDPCAGGASASQALPRRRRFWTS